MTSLLANPRPVLPATLSAATMLGVACLTAPPAFALAVTDCTRTTHISHGGEADHIDLGAGRVMWRDWWSQEGTATGFAVMECASGQVLQFRTAEERMGERIPFDRTSNALSIVEVQHSGARAFATLERLAEALDKTAEDIAITVSTEESCACAVFYGQMRGDKKEFVLGG